MTTLIVVPMKDPARSKTRLQNALSDPARVRLVRLLYRRTLEFLAPVADSTGATLAVVTQSEEARGLADAQNVTVIAEPAGADLSGAVTTAGHWASARGFQRMCVIPADLTAPLERDLIRFLECPAPVTICPSEDSGTNALLVSPPDALTFHYGPNSARAHWRVAEARGLAPVLMPLDSLSFDIDTSDGLRRATASVPDLNAVCR